MFANGMGPTYVSLLLQGLSLTLRLCVLSLSLACVAGVLFGILRTLGRPWLAIPIQAYVEVIRSIPLLLLLFTVFYGFPVVFKLALDPFTAAVVTMGFYQAAFMTQIVRAGIESVPLGQSSAADALGLTYIQKMRNIVMPQALRVILPGAVGLLVSAIKDSSLASVIGLFELTRTALAIRNITLSNWDVLGTLLLLYVVINSIVSVAGGLLERRLAPSENQRQVLDAVLLQIELRQR